MLSRRDLTARDSTFEALDGLLEKRLDGFGELFRMLSYKEVGAAAMLSRAAALADQFDAITRNGLLLAPETVAAIGAAQARRNRWLTIGVWVIAMLLFWMIWRVI